MGDAPLASTSVRGPTPFNLGSKIYVCQIRDNDLIYSIPTVSGTTKVWYFYVSTTSTTNVVQVWYQKGASHILGYFLYYAPNLTFDNLSRSQMTLDSKCSNRSANFFIVISVFVGASGKSTQICGRFKSSAQIGR